MEFLIEKINSCRIAYIRKVGPYGINNIETMDELKMWAKANNLLNDNTIIYGIAQDNPQITKSENCRYDTCIVVPKDYIKTDNNLNNGEITGGKYVIFRIEHTSEAIKKTWTEIFPILLKEKLKFDTSRPILERYAVKMVIKQKCEICLPVY